MGFSQAYGPADDTESVATIRAALDLGVTLLDTAMSYGAGHNEELVGRAIAGRREQAVLASKFGIVRGPGGVRVDNEPGHIRGFCEASLKRLGVESLDLYYLHRIDPQVPVEETIGVMAELVTEGKVAHLGVSEASVGQLERAVATHPISALECEWSLFWREAEDDVVPAARRLGVGLVPYSPLGRGMLTGVLPAAGFSGGDFRASDPRFQGDDLTATWRWSRRCAIWRRTAGSPPGSSRWPGCWPRDQTSSRSRAPGGGSGWPRMPRPPASSCPRPILSSWRRWPRGRPGPATGSRSPRTVPRGRRPARRDRGGAGRLDGNGHGGQLAGSAQPGGATVMNSAIATYWHAAPAQT